jgi:hypothetical protein
MRFAVYRPGIPAASPRSQACPAAMFPAAFTSALPAYPQAVALDGMSHGPAAAAHGEAIRVGQLGRLAADAGHGPVPLTRLEFLLLKEQAVHPGQAVAKSRLLAIVWGYDFDPRIECRGCVRPAAAIEVRLRSDRDGYGP